MTETIKLKKIKISDEMANTYPRISTMQNKYSIYRKAKTAGKTMNFSDYIILDKKTNMLLDGYTMYLVAKAFDEKKITVTYV